MGPLELIVGIILIVMSVFLIIAVLAQSGKEKGLSGSIAGGAETFFGKSKSKNFDKALSLATAIVAIVFAVLVIVMQIVA